MIEIFKVFHIDAAHFLPNVPEGHKCKQLHGHTYHISIYVKGQISPHTGWVMDFDNLKNHFEPLQRLLDHSLLNEIDGLENPTSENLAIWIWNRLKTTFPSLSRVVVMETETNGCSYSGEESGEETTI
jgi:6-pyruvoyltetrahydropterin/6-carboxytetrahydropterin synthase